MKTVRSAIARGLVGLAAVLGALAMLGVAFSVVVLHVSVSPVLTGSMSPTFDPGAAVLTRPVPRSAVQPGDVLVFRPPGHLDSYAHRVVTVSTHDGVPVITTRGDANPSDDPWRAELIEPTAQHVLFAVPHLGRAIVALHQPRTRPIALALAGLVFTLIGVRAVLSSTGKAPSRPTPHAPAEPSAIS